MSLRVLVCGDRNWDDRWIINWILTGAYIEQTVGHLTIEMSEFEVIEGDCSGADSWAHWWAESSPMHSYDTEPGDLPVFTHHCHPPRWSEYGKAAGPIRNREMADRFNDDLPGVVLAFHDDLESSKGTKDMVRVAKERGIPVYVISRQ